MKSPLLALMGLVVVALVVALAGAGIPDRVRDSAKPALGTPATVNEVALTAPASKSAPTPSSSTRAALPGVATPDNLAASPDSRGARILGRVIDEDGEPVSGARVFSHTSEAVTATNGEYSLPMDSTNPTPTLRALADGFAVGVITIGSLRVGDVFAGDLVLGHDFAVEGLVLDKLGNPISGATVRTSLREHNWTSTDDEGRFRLGQLDPTKRRSRVSVLMEGYVTASVYVAPEDAASPVEFELLRGGRISGRVITVDGKPVIGAAVSVGHYPSSTGTLSTRTKAEGAFSMDVVPPGLQSVWAVGEGYAAGSVRVELPEDGAQVVGIEVVLASGFQVAGIVLDEDGEPLPGAQIFPESAGYMRGAPQYIGPGTTSDSAGHFQLDALREERVVLRVWAQGCSGLEQAVSAGTTNVILRPKRAGRLAGRVLDERTGQPIESFVVRLVPPVAAVHGQSLTSYGAEWSQSGVSFVATDGYWTSGLERLELGAVTGIEVSAAGYATSVIGQAEVLRDPAPDELLVELVSGTQLTGFVIDAATGLPLAGARVRRFTDGDPTSTQRYVPDPECTAQTDENGQFTMQRVPSGSMYLFADGTALPLAIDGPFEVLPQAVLMERTIAVGSGARLTGRLLDGDGDARSNEELSLYALDLPGDDRHFETMTDEHGAYSFEGLVPGPYHLSLALTHAGQTVGSDLLRLIVIERGQTLQYDLQPKGRASLRGTIVFDGELPGDLSVRLMPEQESSVWAQSMRGALVKDGEFLAAYLEPGEWTVQVFFQAEGGIVHGMAKVQVPAEGSANVSVPLSAMQR